MALYPKRQNSLYQICQIYVNYYITQFNHSESAIYRKLLLRTSENIRFVRGVYGCAAGIKEWYVGCAVA
jgi:hypothetical protein